LQSEIHNHTPQLAYYIYQSLWPEMNTNNNVYLRYRTGK
jgi:hypothetical protein